VSYASPRETASEMSSWRSPNSSRRTCGRSSPRRAGGALLAQQLVAAGETVVDVPPTLSARARLLDAGSGPKTDRHDARSAAIVALRHRHLRSVGTDDYTVVLRLLADRHHDLVAARTRIVCRLHALLCLLIPGGRPGRLSEQTARAALAELGGLSLSGIERKALAIDLVADLRRRRFGRRHRAGPPPHRQPAERHSPGRRAGRAASSNGCPTPVTTAASHTASRPQVTPPSSATTSPARGRSPISPPASTGPPSTVSPMARGPRHRPHRPSGRHGLTPVGGLGGR
jgi:hypothetical protein